jgi:hypothetical protein
MMTILRDLVEGDRLPCAWQWYRKTTCNLQYSAISDAESVAF